MVEDLEDLTGVRVAILTANEGVEQIELAEPRQALLDRGATVTLVAPKARPVQTMDHLDKAAVEQADRSVQDVGVQDFDALLLPGGVANPDRLRMDQDAVDLVRAFFHDGKPVAAICHAAWMLIEADCVRGRVVTSWPSLRRDLWNAGVRSWVDREVVVCDHGASLLVTSRKPDDLPWFEEAMIAAFARGARTPADVTASPAAGALDDIIVLFPPEPTEPG
jgi:protease I